MVLGEGAATHRLVKVPNDKVAAWDETHDATGKELSYAGNKDNIVTEDLEK